MPLAAMMITTTIVALTWLASESKILRVIRILTNTEDNNRLPIHERLKQNQGLQLALFAVNIISCLFSLWVQAKFGKSYQAVELTGKYAVGHREFHTRKNNGNSISVYYPVSKELARTCKD